MTRTTAILATCFFLISLIIGSISANRGDEVDEFQNIDIPLEQVVPVAPPVPNESDIPGTEVQPIQAEDDQVESDIPN
jgi:preprotein translocase subunit SecG